MKTIHSTKYRQRKFYQFTCVLCMFLFGGMPFSLQAQEKKLQATNFYAITGNGLKDTSWLFGTYHLVKSSYLDEVPAVVSAFEKARGVVVELVLDSAKTVAAASYGLMHNQTLADLLDKPFADSLEQELKSTLGVGLDQVNQLKPVNIAITLSLIYLMTDTKLPVHKYSGAMLDGYFAAAGKKSGKGITELETIEEQMNLLFNSSTHEEQAGMLTLFIRNKAELIRQGNELMHQWFNHDLDKMYAVSEQGLKAFGNEEALLKQRNDKWMKILPGLMKAEPQFIAVGALHLAGPFGLVKQLQQLGYTLTPIKL